MKLSGTKLKIIVVAFWFAVFSAVQLFGLIPFVDSLIFDYILSAEREPAKDIVIVGIDERSIDEIGTWPWSRIYVADAITALTDMGAAAIGVNVLYDTYGADQEGDAALVAAAGNTDRLVLAAMGVFDESSQSELNAGDYVLPFEELSAVAQTGFINAVRDEDRVIRRALTAFRYGDIRVNSLPLEVYRVWCRATGMPENGIPLDQAGQFTINYAAGHGRFTAVSLWGVINGEYDPALFKDAIVLIGPYASGIEEGLPTPLSRGTPSYGVEINANIIQNMMEGRFLSVAAWWPHLLAMAIAAAVLSVFSHKNRPAWTAFCALGLIALLLLGAKLAFSHLLTVFNVGASVLFIIVCFISTLMLGILLTQQDKRHIQDMFGRFVAPEVVNEIVTGNIEVQLGGVEKEITLLFVDIRGFTAFSEANAPAKVVEMVNRYLSLTSRAIQENGGTIDKYIGDATMAVFNAPHDLDDHAFRAVKTAWAMKQGSADLQKEILDDYGVDLQFGIGINTGPAIVGNMGSEFRMDYTAIGDTVNIAARLEGSAQKGQILISEATYSLVKDRVEAVDLGVLNVKNKKVGIQIYNLENVLD